MNRNGRAQRRKIWRVPVTKSYSEKADGLSAGLKCRGTEKRRPIKQKNHKDGKVRTFHNQDIRIGVEGVQKAGTNYEEGEL